MEVIKRNTYEKSLNMGEKLNTGDPVIVKSGFFAWLDNFWYHYKWHSLIALFLVFAITVCTLQMCDKESYDIHILYAGNHAFARQSTDADAPEYFKARQSLARHKNSFTLRQRNGMKQAIEKKKKKNKTGDLYRNFIQLLMVGSITGISAGLVVTVFNILVHEAEEISHHSYAYVRENPEFIPLLLLALLATAFLIGVAVNISTVIKGVGIPQAEGATRGIVPLKWWRDLTLMFATSLLSVFMGLSIGAEGPSALIGACTGDGVAALSRRNQMIRKYQVAGGACTGLAVASNAPLTGMAFAFEEAYKRLTPEVFICSASSVIFGMLTRRFIYFLSGLESTNAFSNFRFVELPYNAYGFVILAGIACGLLGVLFYNLTFLTRKAFKKIKIQKR